MFTIGTLKNNFHDGQGIFSWCKYKVLHMIALLSVLQRCGCSLIGLFFLTVSSALLSKESFSSAVRRDEGKRLTVCP